MQRILQSSTTLPALLLLLPLAVGCRVDTNDQDTTAEASAADTTVWQPGVTPQPAPPQHDMRIEVNLAARELHVYRGGQRVATHGVAVGSEEWPTPTGEWSIGQVIFNPRWVPPDQEWAEDEEISEPGDPDNPLGRVQLVYDPPNSIHGTNAPESIGQAVSHGSIRVTNDVGEQLARQVMEAGGAHRDEAFFERARNNRTERVEVVIPDPVPISVVSG
jgi:lipoprotein-anchoring transpeptidase ErfK/SrfK